MTGSQESVNDIVKTSVRGSGKPAPFTPLDMLLSGGVFRIFMI